MAWVLLLKFFMLELLFLRFTDADNLAIGFYEKSCPGLEPLVRQTVADFVSRERTVAAALLRLHFHDCFVRGCDGSVLLSSTKNNTAERDSLPNLTLAGFHVVDAVKKAVEKECPMTVSCADILALAARDAVSLTAIRTSNGTADMWKVPTGRRDGRVSLASEAKANLTFAYGDIVTRKTIFQEVGLDSKDLVILSGAHTIGVAHCSSFQDRLYNFTGKGDADPALDPHYATSLRAKCKPGYENSKVEMDPKSFTTFDGTYYKLVTNRRGLLHSDASLLDDEETKGHVLDRLNSSNSEFFFEFGVSMTKMGRIGVLSGKDGEIRKHCDLINEI